MPKRITFSQAQLDVTATIDGPFLTLSVPCWAVLEEKRQLGNFLSIIAASGHGSQRRYRVKAEADPDGFVTASIPLRMAQRNAGRVVEKLLQAMRARYTPASDELTYTVDIDTGCVNPASALAPV